MNPWLKLGLGLGVGALAFLTGASEALATPLRKRHPKAKGGSSSLHYDFRATRYAPGSPEQVALFEEAARQLGVPEEWAASPGLINILKNESNGYVGIPNYTYGHRKSTKAHWPGVWEELRRGEITAKSTATGLGQLTLANVKVCYPSGAAGIGDPLEEAIGMLCYIQKRYGTPEEAWAFWQEHHWY